MSAWEQALEDVTRRLNRTDINWMLVGSAATAIHGAAIEPGDIDILIQTAAEVHTAAAILPGRPDRWPDSDPGNWHSSVDQPVLTWSDHIGTRWTFGRWTINGTKVELANLDPPEPSEALIETGAAQSLALELEWHGLSLLVVPIELQIGTMIARDQQDRLRAVLAANSVRDFDAAMLRRTVADRQVKTSDPRIPAALRPVLRDGSGNL